MFPLIFAPYFLHETNFGSTYAIMNEFTLFSKAKPAMSRLAKPDHQWMVVYATHIPTDAHIVMGRLHSEGIPAIINREVGASAMGISIGRLGEVRVLVNAEDYETALMILEPTEPHVLSSSVDKYTFHLNDSEGESDDEDLE